ncbi:MAG: chorismate mutase [Rickettsiales bacterium]
MENPDEKLNALRARIDATDEQLAELLISRIGIINEVAKLKAEHWPNSCHIRPGREG